MIISEEPLQIRSAEQLPWVRVGYGAEIRVPHTDVEAGVFVLNSRLAPGYTSRLHRHSGPVYVLTLSGAWKYAEHEEVNRAGSYLYEPDASSHTLNVLASGDEPTEFWAVVHGALEYIDDQGVVTDIFDAAGARSLYLDACRAAGLPSPDVLGG